MARNRNVELLGAQIIWCNFEGKKGPYNQSGERGFTVVIEDELIVNNMLGQGWNVKELSQRDDAPADTPKRWGLYVRVVFENYPPQVFAVKGEKLIPLNADTIQYLDLANIRECDMVISPYEWSMNGRSGTSAYLHQLYAVINMTALDEKYGEFPAITIRRD